MPTTQVIAYYFHGTVRCETCLRIEKEARDFISKRFVADLASERLVFKTVNYDKPEDAHFWKDNKLPCPSLVLGVVLTLPAGRRAKRSPA